MRVTTPQHVYQELLEQIAEGSALLFLGSGSTRGCRRPDGGRGLTGPELAREILALLSGGEDPGFTTSLTEAAELYSSWKASARGGLDRFLEQRLRGLRPTLGHHLAATFPWRAVVTTNYNRVAEDAWQAARAGGYAAAEMVSVRSDEELGEAAGGQVPLFKPHGCISLLGRTRQRMVITSQDYFASERLRPRMYEAIRELAVGCTTLFVGYSMNDYTFRNIFYRLYDELGAWAVRSYSVAPFGNETHFRWLSRSMDRSFNTTLVDDTFDTFLARLVLARGSLHPATKGRVEEGWGHLVEDNGPWAEGLEARALLELAV